MLRRLKDALIELVVNKDDANGQFMRGGYQRRLNNVKSLLSDLNLTFKVRYYDNVMILAFVTSTLI